MSLDPLMEKSAAQLLCDLPKRFIGLLSKLLGVKAFIFFIATFLMVRSSLPTWAWLTVAIVMVLGREADKHLPVLFENLVGKNVDKD